MRIRRWVAAGSFSAAVMMAPALRLTGWPQPSDSVSAFDGWSPTAAEIHSAVGGPSAGVFNDFRHAEFARLFQQRFRDHVSAVGLHFLNERTIRLMCVACIPRWDMARVAEAAHDEARQAFGQDYVVQIYETNAAGNARLGEARSLGDPNHLSIHFVPVAPPTIVRHE